MVDKSCEKTNSGEPWQALKNHQEQLANVHLRELFQQDATRAEKFSIRLAPLLLDYSKHRITETTLELLQSLAESCHLKQKINSLFCGEHINSSEDRAAMHWLLRHPDGDSSIPQAAELRLVHEQLDRMQIFLERISAGKILSANNKPITRIINIGIGGSDLGPRLVVDALKNYNTTGIEVDFVSNLDPRDMSSALSRANADSTMFIIVSKTFTTLETMANAALACDWLKNQGCAKPESQIIAVTSNREKALEFGVDEERIFEFWDWVGGRYSLWSSVGLSAALSIGMENFRSMLAGAHEIDKHFQTADITSNIPILLGMLDVWYNNFFQCETQAIVPYDESLGLLPAYLSQLVMESNGKSVKRDGQQLDINTSPVVWGSSGTNAQHAFFQMLHQGTHLVPIDFLLPLKNPVNQEQQLKQVANCLAQSEALMMGKDNPEESMKHYPGNTPSSTLLYDELDPYTLGMLLAIYEHRTFVCAMLWDINPFDQFGVELGKKLAGTLIDELGSNSTTASLHDSSTMLLLKEYKDRNGY